MSKESTTEEITDTYQIKISERKNCQLHSGEEGSLFYCVIKKNGEHLHTRQARNIERVQLLALQLLSAEFCEED